MDLAAAREDNDVVRVGVLSSKLPYPVLNGEEPVESGLGVVFIDDDILLSGGNHAMRSDEVQVENLLFWLLLERVDEVLFHHLNLCIVWV